MAASITGQTQNWFTITPSKCGAIVADTATTSSGILAAAFSVDVTIKFGNMSTGFELPAFTPIGFDDAITTFKVSANAYMFAMGHL